MSEEAEVDGGRRRLVAATAALGGAGAAVAALPFLASLGPSARAEAAAAPVEVDVGDLAPGQMLTVSWRGKPVWILRRSPEMLAPLAALESALSDPQSLRKQQPASCANRTRSIRPELLVVVGLCTHLGCTPIANWPRGGGSDDAAGGFVCPCHGARYDFAGRVFKNTPAPDNLEVPPHRYLSDRRLLIGSDVPGA